MNSLSFLLVEQCRARQFATNVLAQIINFAGCRTDMQMKTEENHPDYPSS
jgi:hypothetical protein